MIARRLFWSPNAIISGTVAKTHDGTTLHEERMYDTIKIETIAKTREDTIPHAESMRVTIKTEGSTTTRAGLIHPETNGPDMRRTKEMTNTNLADMAMKTTNVMAMTDDPNAAPHSS